MLAPRAFLPLVIFSFSIQNKGGPGVPGPSPRPATGQGTSLTYLSVSVKCSDIRHKKLTLYMYIRREVFHFKQNNLKSCSTEQQINPPYEQVIGHNLFHTSKNLEIVLLSSALMPTTFSKSQKKGRSSSDLGLAN